MQKLNKYSTILTQDDEQPASRAMLYGAGLKEEDLSKPQVGIASAGWEGNTCNMHLNRLASLARQGVQQSNMIGLIFHTIGVSDGISMGTDGMRYSLQSREIIADSIETVMSAQWYDGLITVMGCDKNMPGALMGMARLNRPSLMIYGGTIASGRYKDQKLDVVSAFEALGKKLAGNISAEDFKGVIQNACPGAGACGGMYTANTMACAIEALGMSLPYSSSSPANSFEKNEECLSAGNYLYHLLEKDIRPSDIMTDESFENAMTVVMALGGSTNAVLHLIAMAKAIGLSLSLDDFQRISNRTPYIADLKPSGRYLMEDLHRTGGTPALLKLLLHEKLLHGDCLTVTGKTLGENLAAVQLPTENQDVILPLANPIKPDGHIQILYGNLAPQGAVAKITGKEGETFTGSAKVFDTENEFVAALSKKEIQQGDVIVLRYQGPKGGPGMPEMLKPTSLIMGLGLGNEVALITDGRFSGGTHGFVVGHICPEAQEGGLIALLENGDTITIDAINHLLEARLSDEEIRRRSSTWQAPPYRAVKGTLYKYLSLVSPASQGCVTDENLKSETRN